jgi:type VI secretion system protein
MDPSQLKVEDEAAFFHDLGALLRTMTAGIMQAIASRSQIKSEFRLEQTMIAPTENNPLKFSATSDEALLRLVRHSEKAYLAGAEAAREAIDDINAHQMAVVAGTEAALRSILRRFKPDGLASRLGGGSALGNLIPLFKKAKYWDFFKALYEEVSEAADDDFHQFFGNEFAKAYEQQLERLRKSRKDDTV